MVSTGSEPSFGQEGWAHEPYCKVGIQGPRPKWVWEFRAVQLLNCEKCHFMITKGIVLVHIVSSKGTGVDKAKIELIANLPTPKTVKDVRSFLRHAGFCRRFIKDFSFIS